MFMFISKFKLSKLLLSSSLLLFLIIGNIYSAEITLAVLDFENNSIFNAENYTPLEAGVAEMMISELKGMESVMIVERKKLHAILDELKINQSGLTHNQSLEAGNIMGADYMIFGSFIVTMNDKIRIDTRMVEVNTGLTVKAEEVTGKTKKLLVLVQKLGEKILQGIDKKLWENKKTAKGQTLDINAVIWFSRGITYRDMKKYSKARECFAHALKIEPDYTQAKEEMKLLSDNIE